MSNYSEDDDLFESETRRNLTHNPFGNSDDSFRQSRHFSQASFPQQPFGMVSPNMNMMGMNPMMQNQMMQMHMMNNSMRGLVVDPLDPDMDASIDMNNSMNNSMHNSMNPVVSPFMPPQAPQEMYKGYHHKTPSSNYTLSTFVGDDYKMKRLKTVAFQEKEPEYPGTAYRTTFYENEDIDDSFDEIYDYDMDNSMMPTRHLTFNGENYRTNTLEDVDDEDNDPFGDDESLFSEASVDLNRNKSIKFKDEFDDSDNDIDSEFKPKLNYSKTIKRAKLVYGNYVIDCPVPKSLLDTYGKKISDSGKEMSYLRYSACTCGPSNFSAFKYDLRQAMYTPRRDTEIMCVVTMYNEDEILLARTLKGIFNNIKNLTNRNHPEWGENSWKKIVITIVSDGRVALNKRSEILLKALGIYQDTYAKSKINNQEVKSHIFEYTSTVGIDTINEDKIHLTVNDNPVQFLFCLKEKNTRKINSHRWCFQAFAPILNPKVVMLLDCGTVPAKDSFYHLWRSFNDPNVAGACGEMRTGLGPNKSLLLNPLVAAQNFEYKISNVLDKPMESVFGFISVLPGAFSAYRYEALLNVNGKGPLEKYFKGEFLHHGKKLDEDDDERELKEKSYRDVGIFTSNMYLAEDRILCFELVAKKGYNYILRYVNEAKAETDVPETIEDFVLQRRRWLNGSLFAACYAIFHWTKIWKTNHSLMRKFVLQMEFYYQLVVILVSWFSLASFFLVFNILTSNLGSETINFVIGKYLSIVSLWFYVAAIICTFVLGFGNTPRGTKKFYLIIAIVFSILMVYMLFAAVYLAVVTVKSVLKKTDFEPIMLMTNYKFRDLVVSMVSTYILYFIAALMYGEPSFMATSFVQYLLLSPTYVNVLNIYSFCNINDISWGTREDPQARDLGQAKSTDDNKSDVLMVINGAEEEEVNKDYVNTLEELRIVPEKVQKVNTKRDKDDNYYALIRTITVLVWLFSNLILIAIVLEIGGVAQVIQSTKYTYTSSNSEVFLSIILWVVAGLAVYRFFGSLLFLIFKAFRPMKWKIRNSRRKTANK